MRIKIAFWIKLLLIIEDFWAMVSLSGCGPLWLRAPGRLPLVDEGSRIVLSVDGGTHVAASEANCLHNREILEPVMDRMAFRNSLDIPSLDVWKAELWQMHQFRQQSRAAAAKKKGHKLKPTAVTTAQLECAAHLDAKAIKRLLSFMRYRFLKGNIPRETWISTDIILLVLGCLIFP